jgi:hypothetical protein
MRLVTEDVLTSAGPDLDPLRPTLGHYDLALLGDPRVGQALRSYLLLTERPECFTSRGWSPEEVFWSRYYWFLRFSKLRTTSSGPDAGLEQQAFQILEHPHPSCLPDWSELERVELMVERDIEARNA